MSWGQRLKTDWLLSDNCFSVLAMCMTSCWILSYIGNCPCGSSSGIQQRFRQIYKCTFYSRWAWIPKNEFFTVVIISHGIELGVIDIVRSTILYRVGYKTFHPTVLLETPVLALQNLQFILEPVSQRCFPVDSICKLWLVGISAHSHRRKDRNSDKLVFAIAMWHLVVSRLEVQQRWGVVSDNLQLYIDFFVQHFV